MIEHERVPDLETRGAVAPRTGAGQSAQPDDDDRCNQRLRLVSLRDEAQLTAAIAVLDELLAQGELSAAADAYLGALTDLIETYERVHVTWPETTGIEVVRRLMDDSALTQSDLARLLGVPRSNVSATMAGTRGLCRARIQALAAHFGLSATVFLDGPPA